VSNQGPESDDKKPVAKEKRTQEAVPAAKRARPQLYAAGVQAREIPKLHSQGETIPLDKYLALWFNKYIQNATSVKDLQNVAQKLGEEEINIAFLVQMELMLGSKAAELGVKAPKLPNIEEALGAFGASCSNSGQKSLGSLGKEIIELIKAIRDPQSASDQAALAAQLKNISNLVNDSTFNAGKHFKTSDFVNITTAIDRSLKLMALEPQGKENRPNPK